MRNIFRTGIFSILFFSSGIAAEAADWKLKHTEKGTFVETAGTADINKLRVNAVLKLQCNKNAAGLSFEMADDEKAQKIFDFDNFEGPSAPARTVPLTFLDLVGAHSTQTTRFTQNGFFSVETRFVFEISQVQANSVALTQLYKSMAGEEHLLRIRIRSFREPYQFIISEFSLSDSRKTIAALAAACPIAKSKPRKATKRK